MKPGVAIESGIIPSTPLPAGVARAIFHFTHDLKFGNFSCHEGTKTLSLLKKNGALRVFPGSHNKKASDEEINLITQMVLLM